MAGVKYGVWCIDEGCFYDPTPRDWGDAQTEAAMNCNTNPHHRFEVRELNPTSPHGLMEPEEESGNWGD